MRARAAVAADWCAPNRSPWPRIDADGVKVHAVVDENRALAVGLAFAAWAVFWTARTLIKIFRARPPIKREWNVVRGLRVGRLR